MNAREEGATGTLAEGGAARKAAAMEALRERAATYGLLARLYHHEVDRELLDRLRALDGGLHAEGGEPDDGRGLMGAFLGACGAQALDELAVDFARLFVVREARDSKAPYPFESVYASAERAVMGDARDAVRALYRAEGLGKSASWNSAEDHIALELEFMQALCDREAEALHGGSAAEARRLADRQRTFLEEHLLAWTEPFCRAMEARARTDFYRGLARFTRAFLVDEARVLAEERV